jgi:hypothetical protein
VVNKFYQRSVTPRRQHLEQPHSVPNPPPAPVDNHVFGDVYVVATPPNRAVFAIHRARSLPFLATSLPLLPPITPNVTLPNPAKRLEFGIREEMTCDIKSKCGKNGNVHHSSQHCRLG